MTTPAKPTRTRVLIFLAIGAGVVGISSFHYRDMVKPIPAFDSLKQITADGMTYTFGRTPRGVQYSFEFTDRNGKRFQTPYMDADEAEAIERALRQRGVTLSVGPWQSALKSDSIFTIYHMTSGDRVLINYADRAAAKRKEQEGATPVMIVSLLIFGGTIFLVRRKHMRHQRQLKLTGIQRG